MEKRNPISRPLGRKEGFAHIEAYLHSGLTPSEYFRTHAISEWQFYKWRKLYLEEHPQIQSPSRKGKQFHRVDIESAVDPSRPISGLEIHYPHG